ncbi:hypothetical protein [Cryptosporangium sp. NPDC051539]|uniref:hypothetical protein n=1 Tax=Cryptosporangium sp. NPDC051539 TaxID=3363962 RepID=UPI0037966207
MIPDEPADDGRDRTLLSLGLVFLAFVVVAASCVGGVAGLKRLYGRPPAPEIDSAGLVAARADAARRVAEVVGGIAPAGTSAVESAQVDACFRGSREFMRWDRFSWRCSSRHMSVRSVALTSMPGAIRAAQAELVGAGWHKEYDYLNQGLTDRVLADPTVTPGPSSSPTDGALAGTVQAAGYSLGGTQVTLGFGRPSPGFVQDCLLFQQVQLGSSTQPYWIERGAVLRGGPLQAVGPRTLLLTVTAQRTWFSR